MEAFLIELARSLAAQGSAYTLLVIVGTSLAYTVHKWLKAESKCFELSSTLNEKRLADHEKRISERSETIQVLHVGAQANQKLAESIAVRTETLNNLIVVVTTGNERLERQLHERVRNIEDRIERLEQGITSALERRLNEALQMLGERLNVSPT